MVESRYRALAASGAVVVPITDDRYPGLLRTIYDPPPLLYVRGQLSALHGPVLAVVGSRRASAVGLRLAARLSSAAAAAGLTICSGLALGIDAAAHRGVLEAGATGIGVMATGIEQVYPRRHRQLAEQLLTQGCLLTELPPGMRPLRHHFPRRNRIISGLSLGVLVIEAALPSGSLITAGSALEQGREVFALPWSPCHPGGAGCLRLIRDGAKMVQDVSDVLDELGPLYRAERDLSAAAVSARAELPGSQARLLASMGCEAVSVDELVLCSGLPAARVLADLSALELQGRVARCSGGYIQQ
jgi:DNA processing protein